MSRVGRNPIPVPSGVTIAVDKGNLVTVKGPKGQLQQQLEPGYGNRTGKWSSCGASPG